MSRLINRRSAVRYTVAAFSFIQTLCISLSASALTVAEQPLFISSQVTPNVMMIMDDSGSMDFESLVTANDGALWWRNNTDDMTKSGFVGWGTSADNSEDAWVGGTQFNFNQAGASNARWKKFTYLFPNGNDTSQGGRNLSDATNEHFAVPPLSTFAYARTAEYNKAYFDPAQIYVPWPSLGGKTFSDMPPATAKADPWRTGSMTINLTANIEQTAANYTFRFYSGMVVPAGTKIYLDGGWRTLTAPGVVPFNSVPGSKPVNDNTNYPVSYFPASFYSRALMPLSYGYTATPTLSGYSPGASLPDLYLYEIKSVNFADTTKYTQAIQNFANWFSYYRKRQLATRGGIAASFKDMTGIRAGAVRINATDKATPAPDVIMNNMSDSTARENFFTSVMAPIGGGGTPNREALNFVGEQFMRTNEGAPVQYACQPNAAILFTDGFSNASTITGVVNEDADKGAPYADTASSTIADIAMKYYTTPLRTGTGFATGKVPVVPACNLANPPNGTDCNKNLHMLTYGVTLGSKGLLFNPDSPSDPYVTPPAWWTTFTNRSPRAVDDLWHATINGRGQMLNARTPVEVASTIKTALNNIIVKTGSASSVSTNSTRLDAGTFVYQAKFDSSDWSGELLSYSVGADGQLTGQAWSTNTGIPAAASRNIVTWNGSSGIDFTVDNWASLSTAQQDALKNAGSEELGQARIEWLRGSNANEVNQGGVFRNRTKKLGDIVNSDPLFVHKEDFGFSVLATEGATYNAFVETKQNKTPMLYAGANDGMLHGFNATTGAEQFAFIPSGVYGSEAAPKLAALTDPGYTHRYLVDGSPRSSDAYINSAWKTVLVGSTGAGGKSVFAVDITSPGNLGASSVLWEFSTATDATHKLGTAMSNPVIARLASGDWVAIFGNGYDSGDTVKLFVVRLSDGVLLKAIDTEISGTNNGLATPLPVDSNNDRITDAVYAGDLLGNMWKFDVSATSSSSWDVAYSQSGSPAPLFNAGRPITTRAIAGRNAEAGPGVMVYFGTGKYFETGDNIVAASPPLDRFYGLYDGGTNSSKITALSQLVQQTITREGVIAGFGGYRLVSKNNVAYTNQIKGWYLDLQSPGAANGAGERVISQALLRAGRIIFTTVIPSGDSCSSGGTSWLMELDAMQGGRLDISVFDVNGDGLINDGDFYTLPDGTKIPVSGKRFDEIIKTPGVIGAGEVEYKYTAGSSGTLGVTLEVGSGDSVGRQSWRQLQ